MVEPGLDDDDDDDDDDDADSPSVRTYEYTYVHTYVGEQTQHVHFWTNYAHHVQYYGIERLTPPSKSTPSQVPYRTVP